MSLENRSVVRPPSIACAFYLALQKVSRDRYAQKVGITYSTVDTQIVYLFIFTEKRLGQHQKKELTTQVKNFELHETVCERK